MKVQRACDQVVVTNENATISSFYEKTLKIRIQKYKRKHGIQLLGQ